MHRTVSLGLVLTLLLAVSGCGNDNEIPPAALKILQNADSFELLSLDPSRELRPADGGFHGWKVLGSTTIKEAATRTKLLDALAKGVAENEGEVAGCFNPRHGIRAKKGQEIVELVICFECLSAQVYVDGKAGKGFLLTSSPQPTFNSVLKQAGVALPKRADEDGE